MGSQRGAVDAARELLRHVDALIIELHGLDPEDLVSSDWWRGYVTLCQSLAEAAAEAAESATRLYHRTGLDSSRVRQHRDQLVQALGDSMIARDEALK